MNIEIISLKLYNENKKVFREIEFKSKKINFIVGDSASGKTGVLECLKYGLCTGAHIEKELLGKILRYVEVRIKLKGSPHIILREYKNENQENSTVFYTKDFEKTINDMNIFTKLNVEQMKIYLEDFNKVEKYVKEYSSVINPKNIFKYSFLKYRDITDPKNLIDIGNIYSGDFINLNMYMFNILDDEIVRKKLLSEDSGLMDEYYKNKDIVERIRKIIDKGYNKTKRHKYSEFMYKILEKSNIDPYYRKLDEKRMELDDKYHELLLKKELLKYEKMSLENEVVNEQIVKFLNKYLLPTDSTKNIFKEIISSSINYDVNYDVNELNNYIKSKDESIEREIKQFSDELENFRKSHIDSLIGKEKLEEEIITFLKTVNNFDILDYTEAKNIYKDKGVKEIIKKAEQDFSKRINDVLTKIYRGKISASSYEIIQDKLIVVGDEGGRAMDLEDTGSSFRHSCRHIATIIALHQYSAHNWSLLMLDQPLQALSTGGKEKVEEIKHFWSGINSCFPMEANKEVSQLIIIEEKDNITGDKLNHTFKGRFYTALDLSDEKLVPDKFCE